MTIILLRYESFQGLLKYAIKSILTKMTKSDLMKIAAEMISIEYQFLIMMQLLMKPAQQQVEMLKLSTSGMN